MPSMQQIQDALAFSALADNPNLNVALSAGWSPLSQSDNESLVFVYGGDGLQFTVYVNTSTKQITIAFGANINSSAPTPISKAVEDALLMTPFVSPSSLELMSDAAALVLHIFATTQPGYTGSPIATDANGNPIGPGYTLFVTGAGLGGAAAEYAMESVLTSFPIAQANNLISGISFGGPGLYGASAFESGVNFTSYVLYSDLFAVSPGNPYHVGNTVTLGPTLPDYINDIVIAPLAGLAGGIAGEVIPDVTKAYIEGTVVEDYARALLSQSLIQSNPLTSVVPSHGTLNFQLNEAFPSMTNYAQTLNPSSTVLETQSGIILIDGVTQTISLTNYSDGTATLIESEEPIGVQATETINYDSSGNETQNQIEIDGATINVSGTESAALASTVDGSLLVVFSPTSTSLGDFELIANQDGSTELVGVNSNTGDAQEVVGFTSDGLSDDSLNVAENSTGTVEVTTSIEPGTATDIGFDRYLPDVRDDFEFSNSGEVLQIGPVSDFNGTISDFVQGDTIDLSGIGTVTVSDQPDGGTLTLADGLQLNFAVSSNIDISSPAANATPEQVLLDYLSDFGDPLTAAQLDADNYNYLNTEPMAQPQRTDFGVANGTDYVDYLYLSAGDSPDIIGQTTTTVGDVQYPVHTQIAVDDIDFAQTTLTNIQEFYFLYTISATTLTEAQFDAVGEIMGGPGDTIVAATGGTFDLTTRPTLDISLSASDWIGTTLIGNNQNNETLAASLFGNDTLLAGNGTGDMLIAGEGVDTLVGGTGGDIFSVGDGLAAGSVVTGNGASNILQTSDDSDINQGTITGMQALELFRSSTSYAFSASITLDATELNEFHSIESIGKEYDDYPALSLTITAATGGTYSLVGISTGIDEITVFPLLPIALVAGADDGTTLIGNGDAGDTLVASATGDDSLLGGIGAGDTLVAGSGNDFMQGNGGSVTYEITDGGTITINNYHTDDGQSVIDFEGVSFSEAVASQSGNDLVLSAGASQVTVQDFFEGPSYQVASINFTDGVSWTPQNIPLSASDFAIGGVSPQTLEAGQITVVGTIEPDTAGDTFALSQTTGEGTLNLGAVQANGAQQIIYTAPMTVAASLFNPVDFRVTDDDNGEVATGTIYVSLDAGPSISAVLPSAVEPGQTTEVATVTPGLNGDTLALTQTGGIGTLALQEVNGVEEVIYIAPEDIPAYTTDDVTYQISDQYDDVIAPGTASVPLEGGLAGGSTISANSAVGIYLRSPIYSNPIVVNPGVTITGTIDGIYAQNGTGAWTIRNAGSIGALGTNGYGIRLRVGGSVTNQSGATISGWRGISSFGLVYGALTVVNDGVIIGGNEPTLGGEGVIAGGGGAVTNQSNGTITADVGIYGFNSPLSVLNAGSITGNATSSSGKGVDLKVGGSVTNFNSALISGYTGIYGGPGGALAVANVGIIMAGDGTLAAIAAFAGGSVSNASTGTITGTAGGGTGDGVYIKGGLGTVINAGSIAFGASHSGVVLVAGGLVSNATSGTISSTGSLTDHGVYIEGAVGTVINTGSIGIGGTHAAVELEQGGYVTNSATGVISGPDGSGAYLTGGPSTVVNAGQIAFGASHSGVILFAGGMVSNANTGTISSTSSVGKHGIYIKGGAGTVLNAGSIGDPGTAAAVSLYEGGLLSNASTGTITGSGTAVYFSGGSSTLINSGLIAGAADLSTGFEDRLVVDAGSVFDGTVNGGNTVGSSVVSTLELVSASSAGTLSGLGTQFFNFSQITIDTDSSWTLTGTNTLITGTTLTNGGTLTLSDALLNDAGTVINNNSIIVDPSTLVLAALSGTGDLVIDSGSTVTIDGPVSAGETILFSGTAAVVNILDSASFAGIIQGQGPSDQVNISCFAAGTFIETASGQVRVEELSVHDHLRTALGGPGRIVWIGSRKVNCTRHPHPETVWPVRVRAGAFATGMPRRDLWLSPDHAVFTNNVLVPIKHLINGCTIMQEPCDEVTYYHVELEQHNVVLAEGLHTESYLDTGDRLNFENGDGPVRLHPEFSVRIWEAEGCAPLIVTGPMLAAVRARLLQRAARLAARSTRRSSAKRRRRVA